MARTYLTLENNKWKEVENSDFWIDSILLDKLNNLRRIQHDNWDGVIIVDGKERSGKSVLAMILGWYLSNGNLTLNNFARGLEDAAKKIAELPDKSVLIVDEGSLVFSSKDSNNNAQKKLLKIMDVVGQKNMIFIICLPCFFDLNKTIAVRRSIFLCHVTPGEEYKRGIFVYYGEKEKKELYINGKKNYDSYAFPYPTFPPGEYMDFEPPFYQEYKEIVKKESLKEVLKDAIETASVFRKEIEVETIFYGWIREKYKTQYKELMKIRNQPESTIVDRVRAYKKLKNSSNQDPPQEEDAEVAEVF